MPVDVCGGRAPLRIALIAPPWYPVPPEGYGGIELVVGLLSDELRMQGHEVLLFAAEGSRDVTHACAPRDWGADLGREKQDLRGLTYACNVMRELERVGPVDVIHDHLGGALLLALTFRAPAPVVHTVHGPVEEPERTFFERLSEDISLVAISQAQRSPTPALPWVATVHNAVDVGSLVGSSRIQKESFLLCMARICPDKGQHIAIEVARRVNRRLVLAGKVEPTTESNAYYERRIRPEIDGDRVVHLHNVGGPEKAQLLARAAALLAPLEWDEPFGLALAEAMVSGTPVVAFPRGAARELVQPGVTGYLVSDVDGMVAAVEHATGIDPVACSESARARFSPSRMARDYLAAYESVTSGAFSSHAPAAEPALAG